MSISFITDILPQMRVISSAVLAECEVWGANIEKSSFLRIVDQFFVTYDVRELLPIFSSP